MGQMRRCMRECLCVVTSSTQKVHVQFPRLMAVLLVWALKYRSVALRRRRVLIVAVRRLLLLLLKMKVVVGCRAECLPLRVSLLHTIQARLMMLQVIIVLHLAVSW